MLRQRTLKSFIRASGVGLHTGAQGAYDAATRAADTGIVFRRIDLAPGDRHPGARRARRRNTPLFHAWSSDGVKVHTVEHLMSALGGLGVDNAYVDLDAAELPIMDGSASPFVLLVQQAGIEEQAAPKRFLRVKRRVEVNDGDKWARLEPYDGYQACRSRSSSAIR